jgi:hypothetical protein
LYFVPVASPAKIAADHACRARRSWCSRTSDSMAHITNNVIVTSVVA